MCGIAGARNDWLIEQGLDPQAAIAAATKSLAWRGPDGQATEQAGSWLLGCARLAISGPNARQPVKRRGGRFVGVMNGAITDARFLWRKFSRRVHERDTLPNDAWLPLLAISNDQPDLLTLMQGHHAYAVVDTKTDELILGQDFYGQKPLHCLVAQRGSTWQLVAFASTPAALRHLGMPALDFDRRLAQWFRFGWHEQRPHRFSARLKLDNLPVRGAPLRIHPTATGFCEPLAAPLEIGTPTCSNLRDQIDHSVTGCTDSPSPSALFLSGGIDSSGLAFSLASCRRPIPAYQFRADGTPTTEREAARAVAAEAGLPFHEVDGGPEILEALPELTRLAGQPLGDPSILAVHAVARRAASDGIRIMLGGEGADELQLGYQRYRALARLPRIGAFRRRRPFADGWSMHKAIRYWRAVIAENPVRALLAVTPPAFAANVLAEGIAERRCWRDAEPLPDADNLALAARQDDLANYLPRDLLPKFDIALMAAGIEGRCPYLEASIAAHGTHMNALGKRMLIGAFVRQLPPAVQRLPKFGFALPLNDWFRGESTMLDVLAEPRSRDRAHLRPGGLATAIDRHRSGRSDLGHGLYLLLSYELFLRSQESA